RSATASTDSAPRPNAIRRGDPSRFVTTGRWVPGTFSKSRAGPSARRTFWVTSVISRSLDTGRVTRTKSPRDSSAVRKSPRDSNATRGVEPSGLLNAGARVKVHIGTSGRPRDADGHARGPDGGPRGPGAHPRGTVRQVRRGRATGNAPPRAGVAPPAPEGPAPRAAQDRLRARARISAHPRALRPREFRACRATAPDPRLHSSRPPAQSRSSPTPSIARRWGDLPDRAVPDHRRKGHRDVPRAGRSAAPSPETSRPGGVPLPGRTGVGPTVRSGRRGGPAHRAPVAPPGSGVGDGLLRGPASDHAHPPRAAD